MMQESLADKWKKTENKKWMEVKVKKHNKNKNSGKWKWHMNWNWWKTRQRYAAVILKQRCQHTRQSHQMQQHAIDFDQNCRFAKDLLLLNIVQLHTMPNLLLWVCGMSEKKWEMKQILSDAILLSSRYRWVSFSQCLQSFFSGHVAEKKFKQTSKTFDFHVKPFYLIVILWVKS